MDTKKPKIGVGVVVLREGKVLLGKRKNAHGQGKWAFPGGKLEWKETVTECAVRELEEETGLRARKTKLLAQWSENQMENDNHFVTLFVQIDEFDGEPERKEVIKCEGWQWFSWDRLPSPLFEPVAAFVENRAESPIRSFVKKLLTFYQERDWEQYHSPKNLVMNLASEVGELIDPFRWLTEQQSFSLDEKTLSYVKEEVGDVLMALLYLSEKLGFDPLAASIDKLAKIEKKYPAYLCRGKSLKYTAYTALTETTLES